MPDTLSDDEAALLEPLSVGIQACQKVQVGPNSKVLIPGARPIGVVIIQPARAMGASDIIVTDLQTDR